VTEDPHPPASQTKDFGLIYLAVHILVTGAGILMILLAPREVGGGYFFLSLFIMIAGSNVVVALIKWFVATPNKRSRVP